jgi:cyclohexadienyl dehydratase
VARPLHGPTGARARAATLIRLLAWLLVGLAACTPALRVGSTGDYPPFSEHGATGWSGFDVEVARAWSRDLRRRLVLLPVRWPDVEGALRRNEVDVVMSGVTVRADRLLEGRFTTAVARDEAVVVGRRNAPRPTRIAGNRGGHLERLARARLPGVQLELVDDNRRLRSLLDSNEVEGIVTDTLELRALAPDLDAAGLAVVATLSDDRKAYFLPADAAPLAGDLDAWITSRERDGWLPALRMRLLGDGTPEPRPAAVARVTDLLARRLMLMPAVAAAKRASGLAVVDPAREAEVESRAVARAASAGLSPEPYRALVRAQIKAARAVQDATPGRSSTVSLTTVRAAIDRVDETLLPALVDAVPITTPGSVLVGAIRREASVPGLSDDVMGPVADALRSLAPAGQSGRGPLRGAGASAKLSREEERTPMAKAIWNGATLAESDRCQVVEGNQYFPPDAVRREYLRDSATHSTCPWKGVASYYDVVVDGEINRDAAWSYPAPKDAAANIKDHVAFWHGVRVEP